MGCRGIRTRDIVRLLPLLRDATFDELSKLVKLPFGLNHGDLKLNPVWDDLRNDPRFDRILAESALPLATDG
jgi:hypothetical protein